MEILYESYLGEGKRLLFYTRSTSNVRPSDFTKLVIKDGSVVCERRGTRVAVGRL